MTGQGEKHLKIRSPVAAGFALAMLMVPWAGAAAATALSAAQKSAACGTRSTCAIGKIRDAGDCLSAMTISGANGFMVFGNPAPPAQAAEVEVIAESYQSLVIQVYDPAAASPPASLKGSWINLPHAEVWIGLNTDAAGTRLPVNELTQIGVDLNGKVYAGVGKKEAPPAVERWQARDGAGRPVIVMRLTWPNENEFLNGMAIVYSQDEGGKQAPAGCNHWNRKESSALCSRYHESAQLQYRSAAGQLPGAQRPSVTGQLEPPQCAAALAPALAFFNSRKVGTSRAAIIASIR